MFVEEITEGLVGCRRMLEGLRVHMKVVAACSGAIAVEAGEIRET
jgi:hypothetical protein